ncbi:replication-associated recombination protein A [Glycomyces sp. L485]|uniref:replication-associated recombination protein A n=1 Tax=Glycomyces sp. L485 TaxID=2909235 RepID=UPI001F4A3E73|nr:replication-associated recombination protein A [Glycomyces sp. L485]MCH7231809.1 replication-associated recombination protein A [Glycomyces sp. L485]
MDAPGLFELAEPPDSSGSGSLGTGPASGDEPLAVRMRPHTLDELVGQDHLLTPGSPLRQVVEGGQPMSVILWGPPGSGKTTIAHLVARSDDRRFRAMSALNSGVKDVRAAIEEARRVRRTGGPQTILFIDEVHRFTKTQQDSLLSAVEDRTITLLAATTENPYFSVVAPLVSRCVLLTLRELGDTDVAAVIDRALEDPRGLGKAVELTDEARDHLIRTAAGDARKALTALEAAAASRIHGSAGTAERAEAEGDPRITVAVVEAAIDTAAVRYDRDGDGHYDVASAFIKSLRGSDVDAAMHYLARMVVAGEDPRFIARRLVIFASEDVGMADPTALQTATAAATAVERIGLPEARINLAQAVVHLATAPKSNAVITAIDEAIGDVRSGKIGPVPPDLRDAHYKGSAELGHGAAYVYPHDDPLGVVPQRYAPDVVAGHDYYRPTRHGDEAAIADRLEKLRRIVRKRADD